MSPVCITEGRLIFKGLFTPGINQVFLDLGVVQEKMTTSYPNLTTFDFYGSLQKANGQQPSPLRPSPEPYMDDCVHANTAGWNVLMEKFYESYWKNEFD